jgi:hypothetical protein
LQHTKQKNAPTIYLIFAAPFNTPAQTSKPTKPQVKINSYFHAQSRRFPLSIFHTWTINQRNRLTAKKPGNPFSLSLR